MKVIINTTSLLSKLTGIGNYVLNICKTIEERKNYELICFKGYKVSHFNQKTKAQQQLGSALPTLRKYLPFSYQLRNFIQKYTFKKTLKKFKPELYHEPNFIPLNLDIKTIINVHDLSWIKYPDYHPIERVRHLNKNFEKALNESVHIITDSETIKKEIVKEFNVSAEKITSIPLACNEQFKIYNKNQCEKILKRYDLTYKKFFLSVSTLEPRKRIDRLLIFYSKLKKSIRDDYPLVIIGMSGWGNLKITELVQKLNIHSNVKFLGYIDAEDMTKLYASAKISYLFSEYEGFGFPILESISCGTPIISSNLDVFKEIHQNIIMTLDDNKFQQAIDEVNKLIADQKYYNSIMMKLKKIAQNFSWSQTAAATEKVYEKVTK